MRHAVYFAPEPETALHDVGSRWLGRDAFSGGALPQPDLPGISELTAEARRYGFHATLKPPFAIADGMDAQGLVSAMKAVCGSLSPLSVELKVNLVDGFLALVPKGHSLALDTLAARCMREFDSFRRIASEPENAKRRAAGLSPRQESHLLRWGYPYVFEDFRFHMTLSRRLDADEAALLMPAAHQHFARVLAAPVTIGALTLFREPAPGAAFEAVRQFAFTAIPAEARA